MQETSIVTHPQRDAMLRYYDLYWVSQLLRHAQNSLRPSMLYTNTFSFTMASKAWNDVLPDLLVRIKPKDTLQYIYEMISGL